MLNKKRKSITIQTFGILHFYEKAPPILYSIWLAASTSVDRSGTGTIKSLVDNGFSREDIQTLFKTRYEYDEYYCVGTMIGNDQFQLRPEFW